jgi:hypothetical protein
MRDRIPTTYFYLRHIPEPLCESNSGISLLYLILIKPGHAALRKGSPNHQSGGVRRASWLTQRLSRQEPSP